MVRMLSVRLSLSCKQDIYINNFTAPPQDQGQKECNSGKMGGVLCAGCCLLDLR